MKKILILFISLLTTLAYAQTEEPFPYQREWVTAGPFNHPNNFSYHFFPSGATLCIGFNYNNGQYDEFITEDTELKHFIIAKISPNQAFEFAFPFGSYESTTVIARLTDDENNFYLGGPTQQTVEIGTPGTHQPNFPGNMTLPDTLYFNENDYIIYPPRLCYSGYVVKYDENGNKQWGTYLNGDQEEWISTAVAKNNEVVVLGKTFSNNGLSTPGVFMEEAGENLYYHNQRNFVAKLNAQNGNLLWASYLPIEGVSQLAVTSTGEVIMHYPHPYSHILKISADGTNITEHTLEGVFSGPHRIALDSEDNLYLYGQTASEENITTPGTYKTIKTNDIEGYVLKYDSSLNKLWGTYVPHETNFGGLMTAGITPHTGDHGDINVYVNGATQENNLASDGVYQENLAGGTDGYVLKLNPNGQLNWFTYYGSTLDEYIYSTQIDQDNNLYFVGLSSEASETSGILTENPLFDYPQYPVSYNFIGKFTHVKNVSHPQQEYSFRLYPNPATDYLAVESTFLFDNKTQLTVYDMQGKLIYNQPAAYSNTQVIQTTNWAKGNYLLIIENNSFKKEFKFVVR